MKLCNRQGCNREARWSPVLLLYAPRKYGAHPPIQSHMTMGVCDVHRAGIQLADLMDDAGWVKITAAVAASGRAVPDRSRTQLAWETCARSEEAFAKLPRPPQPQSGPLQ